MKLPPKAKTALIALLAIVFAVSAVTLVRRGMDYKTGDREYAEAESLAELPDLSGLVPPTPPAETTPEQSAGPEAVESETPWVDPYADALRNMDFTALRQANDDVLGWILIPGTAVSYPVVQGEDNSYYLNHTWRGTRSAVGAIFLECQNSASMTDFNTIIYGHRMGNGSMFHSLLSYKSQDYWAEHPYIYLTDDSGTRRFEIFAAYEAGVTTSTYQLGFSGQESRQRFLEECAGQSVIATGVTPHTYDQVLTLSTCTGNGHATRWVVQAVCPGTPEETASPEPSLPPEEGAPETPGEDPTLPAETELPEEPISPPEAEGARV